MMKLRIRDIDETAVLQFMTWRYPPPYDVYNMSHDGQTDFSEAIDYFLNPVYEFYILYAEQDELVGFFSFGSDAQVPGGNYIPPAIDIGLAVKPEYTGRGLGIYFAKTAVSYAINKYHPPQLRVTIADFNDRAKKVWRRLGFEKSEQFVAQRNKRPFIIMTKEVLNNE